MSTPLNGRVSSLRGKGGATAAGSGGSVSTSGGSGFGGGQLGKGYPISNPNGRGVAEFAARQTAVESRLLRLEEGARSGQISFTSLLDGDMRAHDLLGNLKMTLGKQSDGKWGVTYSGGQAPPVPSDPLVSARQLGFVVGWDGTFAKGFDKPSDLSRVDVHVSTEGPDFVPDQGTAYGSIFSEGAQPVFGNIQTYWVKLVAVSVADVPSPPSAAVSVTPLPAKALAAEVIAGIHFAGEIFMGTTFFAGDPKGSHAEFNKSGFALYREDQTPTVAFSTEEGNALITGTIQTAPPKSNKARIVFNPFPGQDYNAIRFYSPGDTTWSSLAAAYGADGSPGAVQLAGPLNSASNTGAEVVVSSTSTILGTVSHTLGLYTNSLLVNNNFQQLGGSAISVLMNYNRGDYRDMWFGWQDTVTSNVHQYSVLELTEGRQQNNIVTFPIWACGGNNVALLFRGGSLEVRSYDLSTPANIYAANTSSSEVNKTNIEDMDVVLNAESRSSALDMVNQIAPRKFERVDHSSDLTYIAPPAEPSAQLALMNNVEPSDPSQVDPIEPVRADNQPEFGLIAEEVQALAPEAVSVAPGGSLHVNLTALIAMNWAATRELSAQFDELSTRVDSLAS